MIQLAAVQTGTLGLEQLQSNHQQNTNTHISTGRMLFLAPDWHCQSILCISHATVNKTCYSVITNCRNGIAQRIRVFVCCELSNGATVDPWRRYALYWMPFSYQLLKLTWKHCGVGKNQPVYLPLWLWHVTGVKYAVRIYTRWTSHIIDYLWNSLG